MIMPFQYKTVNSFNLIFSFYSADCQSDKIKRSTWKGDVSAHFFSLKGAELSSHFVSFYLPPLHKVTSRLINDNHKNTIFEGHLGTDYAYSLNFLIN